jgi:hypothetical protein
MKRLSFGLAVAVHLDPRSTPAVHIIGMATG